MNMRRGPSAVEVYAWFSQTTYVCVHQTSGIAPTFILAYCFRHHLRFFKYVMAKFDARDTTAVTVLAAREWRKSNTHTACKLLPILSIRGQISTIFLLKEV